MALFTIKNETTGDRGKSHPASLDGTVMHFLGKICPVPPSCLARTAPRFKNRKYGTVYMYHQIPYLSHPSEKIFSCHEVPTSTDYTIPFLDSMIHFFQMIELMLNSDRKVQLFLVRHDGRLPCTGLSNSLQIIVLLPRII